MVNNSVLRRVLESYKVSPEKRLPCDDCNGKGWFSKPYPYDNQNWKCTDCHGSGTDPIRTGNVLIVMGREQTQTHKACFKPLKGSCPTPNW